jgi:hypothetical protein
MNSTLTPIAYRVARWSGVDIDPVHDGLAFRVGSREFARLSSRGDLTVPTSRALRDQLLTDGFADTVPDRSDVVRYRVRSGADVPGAIRLLRVAYLQHTAAAVRAGASVVPDDHLRRLGGSTELVALLVGPKPPKTSG